MPENIQLIDDDRTHLEGGRAEQLAAFGARVTGTPASVFADVLTSAGTATIADGARLFPSYLAAVEGLASYVDRWSHP